MAQGKKYNDDVREKAFALLALNNNCAYVAQALDLPYTTVKTWERKWLREAEEKAKAPQPTPSAISMPEGEGSVGDGKRASDSASGNSRCYDEVTNDEGLNLVELRQRKKEEFVNNAWRMLDSAQSLLERRLMRAIAEEDKLDALLDAFENIKYEDNKGLSDKALRELYGKFSVLKLEDIRALSTVLGTLYDKQALASKEPTTIVDGAVEVKKFEEM